MRSCSLACEPWCDKVLHSYGHYSFPQEVSHGYHTLCPLRLQSCHPILSSQSQPRTWSMVICGQSVSSTWPTHWVIFILLPPFPSVLVMPWPWQGLQRDQGTIFCKNLYTLVINQPCKRDGSHQKAGHPE